MVIDIYMTQTTFISMLEECVVRNRLKHHEQRYEKSCIPSSFEMVLKLLEKDMSSVGSFFLQDKYKNDMSEQSFKQDFPNGTLDIIFNRIAIRESDINKKIQMILNALDGELNDERFPIIETYYIDNGHLWVHAHVVFRRDGSGDCAIYHSVTFCHGGNIDFKKWSIDPDQVNDVHPLIDSMDRADAGMIYWKNS